MTIRWMQCRYTATRTAVTTDRKFRLRTTITTPYTDDGRTCTHHELGENVVHIACKRAQDAEPHGADDKPLASHLQAPRHVANTYSFDKSM